MSSSEKDLFQEILQEFTEGLHSLVPLRHFTEYHGEDKIRRAAQQESNKVLNSFIRKTEAENDLRVKGDMLKELCLELEKLIEDHLRKNQGYKARAESFLKKRTDDLCEDFKGTYEAKLLLSPDMDLKSAKRLLENGKMLALCYFEDHSNFGNIGSYEEQKNKLQEKLEVMCKEMLEKHGHLLESRARKSQEEIKKIARDMSGEIQRDISTLDDVLSGNMRKARLVHDYLSETGHVTDDKDQILHEELFDTVEGVLKYLNDAKENVNISLEDGIGWARRLDVQLHAYCFENEKGSLDIMKPQDQEKKTAPESINNVDDQVKSKTVREEEPFMEAGNPSQVEVNDDQESTAVSPSSSSDSNLTRSAPESSKISDSKSVNELFLRAIWEGQSGANIQKILDDGANVNIKTSDGDNAAHYVMLSLINKKLTPPKALSIFNLLAANGFNLVNERNTKGWTPLLQAMQYPDLNEGILCWFFNTGADFNAATVISGTSVLLLAVSNRHGARIVRKILEFGANPKHVTKFKASALHLASAYANVSALEIFKDNLDLNALTVNGYTPLHLLFMHDDLDYQPCLEILLKTGADFNAKSNTGYVPLAIWVRDYRKNRRNPFPALMKVIGMLPITDEIASVTLSVIVEEMDHLQTLLPDSSRGDQNEFAQFITFLIHEKKAEIQWKNKDQRRWMLKSWRTLEKDLLSLDFLWELKNNGFLKSNSESITIGCAVPGKLDFHSSSSGIVTISIEIVVACLLACKNYNGFVKLCQFLKSLNVSEEL